MTWEVIATVFVLKVVARKGQEISRKLMVKALMWVTPSIARWGNFHGSMDDFVLLKQWGGVTEVFQPTKKL